MGILSVGVPRWAGDNRRPRCGNEEKYETNGQVSSHNAGRPTGRVQPGNEKKKRIVGPPRFPVHKLQNQGRTGTDANRPPWLTKSRARLSLPSYLVVVVAGHVISARCNEENYRRRAQQMPPPRPPIAPSDAPCVTRRDKSSLRRAVGPSLLCPALYFADE